MSQKEMVLNHLETYGTITPLEALTRYGVMRLAAVVHKLKNDGFSIRSTMKQHDGRQYASYSFGTGEDYEQDEQMVLL